MKETTKMSRAVGQLEKMYNTINLDLWGGQLPTPIITVQSKPGTYGHCSVGKVWKRKDADTYEMNIAAEALDVEIEEVLDTLIHEMVHLYCRENGIQEVSRGGKYHNGKFKEIAEEHTVILSTHILSEVQATCDYIRMIEKGQVVFAGTMEVFDNYIVPNTIFVSLASAPPVDELKMIFDV